MSIKANEGLGLIGDAIKNLPKGVKIGAGVTAGVGLTGAAIYKEHQVTKNMTPEELKKHRADSATMASMAAMM